MRTLKLTIAYEGTDFGGWQRQRGHQAVRPTIQETLEQAVRTITGEPVSVVGSGRTDAGVHALAQVAHIRLRSEMPCARLQLALNGLLPRTIAVLRIEDAPPEFHAQYSAVAKRYRYRIALGAVALPFDRRYVWHARVPLNVALMRRELRALTGTHNFRAFARAGRPVKSFRRRILGATLVRRGGELVFEVDGTGFLHTMVRSLVGTLVDVGRGRLPPGTLQGLLASGRRAGAGRTAPPQGLCLVQVSYGRQRHENATKPLTGPRRRDKLRVL